MKLENKSLFHQRCFINGKWVNATNKKTITVKNPFDHKVIGTVPRCGRKETQQAIEAANKAWPAWRELTNKQRSDVMWRWADLIRANKEDLAIIMTTEQGKPIKESRGEIDYANSFIEWFAEDCRRAYGDVISSNLPNQHLIVIKQSVGVVGSITPWNFPASMITRKCAPAIAAGCPVIIKPAEATPFTALALAKLAEDAGFPKGVINVITGDAKQIGLELTKNPLVRKISFTGSTEVGKLLMEQAASTVKKISLELGGNAPFIVFDDADLSKAVQGAIACKFRNMGQTCVCANRILVQDKIYDKFTKKFLEAVKKLKVGNGMVADTDQGPLINNDAIKKVKAHIADAVRKGAKIIYGGKPHELGGTFFQPTVLVNMKQTMLMAKEETFGPVAGLFKFKTEEEAIAMANDTQYGLASYFYSTNFDRVWRVSESLEYGMVGINTGILSTAVAPFGGIKESGIGREGSKYGMDEYLEIKYLCMQA